MIPATRENVGYWATVEHFHTWTGEGDATLLKRTQDNGGQLTDDVGATIARQYRVARGFRGVRETGYGSILKIVNEIPIGSNLSFSTRVGYVVEAVVNIKNSHDHRAVNPSAVTKWMWFRSPDDWYIYDNYAARAVGAGEASIRGMRAFFGILHAAEVHRLNRQIADLVKKPPFQDLRPERIIDKALWLIGGSGDGKSLNPRRVAHSQRALAQNPPLHDLATEVNAILPFNYFDPLKDPA